MNRYPVKSIYRYTLVISMFIVLHVVGPAGSSVTEPGTGYTPEECIECHRTGSEESELQISVKAYEASVHGPEITCLECHIDVVDEEHQSTEGSGAADCSACHDQEDRHGLNGPEEKRPRCHDCHTRHDMRPKTDPASAVHPDQLPTTCFGCHPVESGEADFFSWFPAFQIASHNKADFAGAYEKDICLGCHQGAGAHGESAPINEQNCYKCHFSPESDGAMWGRMHPVADMQSQPAVFAAASIYQVLGLVSLVVLLGRFFRARFRSPPRQIKNVDVNDNTRV